MTRGQRMIATGIFSVIAAIVMVLLALQVASNPDVQTNLGDPEYQVGNVHRLAPQVAKDGPLLFQDLLQRDRDLFISHVGADPLIGWHAFEAHAPGQARTCVLVWRQTKNDFRDPCTGKTHAITGAGLRTYETRVDRNILVVDLRVE